MNTKKTRTKKEKQKQCYSRSISSHKIPLYLALAVTDATLRRFRCCCGWYKSEGSVEEEVDDDDDDDECDKFRSSNSSSVDVLNEASKAPATVPAAIRGGCWLDGDQAIVAAIPDFSLNNIFYRRILRRE